MCIIEAARRVRQALHHFVDCPGCNSCLTFTLNFIIVILACTRGIMKTVVSFFLVAGEADVLKVKVVH